MCCLSFDRRLLRSRGSSARHLAAAGRGIAASIDRLACGRCRDVRGSAGCAIRRPLRDHSGGPQELGCRGGGRCRRRTARSVAADAAAAHPKTIARPACRFDSGRRGAMRRGDQHHESGAAGQFPPPYVRSVNGLETTDGLASLHRPRTGHRGRPRTVAAMLGFTQGRIGWRRAFRPEGQSWCRLALVGRSRRGRGNERVRRPWRLDGAGQGRCGREARAAFWRTA